MKKIFLLVVLMALMPPGGLGRLFAGERPRVIVTARRETRGRSGGRKARRHHPFCLHRDRRRHAGAHPLCPRGRDGEVSLRHCPRPKPGQRPCRGDCGARRAPCCPDAGLAAVPLICEKGRLALQNGRYCYTVDCQAFAKAANGPFRRRPVCSPVVAPLRIR